MVLDPLAEHEEEGLVEVVGPGESGSPPPGNPLAATLSKLTDIVSLLAEDKKKAKGTPKLDIALDSAQGSSSSNGLSLGAGRKTAACSKKGAAFNLFGAPGGDLQQHREVYVRGLGFTDSWTGPAAAWAQCTSLGRVPVEDHELQDWSPLRLVLCGHLGRHGGRALRPRSCSSMSGASSTGPSRNRPRQLDACSGVEPGAKPADDGSCKP